MDAAFNETEREIIPLLADGLDDAEIASALCKSCGTVRNNRLSIQRKAGVSGLAIVTWARGWVSGDARAKCNDLHSVG